MTPEFRIALAQMRKNYPMSQDRRQSPRGPFYCLEEFTRAKDIYWEWFDKVGGVSPLKATLPPLKSKYEATLWYLYQMQMMEKYESID